jgi:predicted DNA repair protein MutK
MAITLASLPPGSFWMQATVLAAVGIVLTVAVYGAVALIVKADDAGVALSRYRGATPLAGIARGFGRLLVKGMPGFLSLLGTVGTVAMLWVGGGILLHGLEGYGVTGPAHLLHAAAAMATEAAPPALAGTIAWVVNAIGAALVGLVVGAALVPLVSFGVAPLLRRLRGGGARRAAAAAR